MGFRLFEFECTHCAEVWEDLVDREEVESTCPCCLRLATEPTLSVPNLAVFSMMNAADKDMCLKKRSVKHTQEEIVNKTPEKWGGLGINLARHGQIRSAGGIDTDKSPGQKKKKAAKGTK